MTEKMGYKNQSRWVRLAPTLVITLAAALLVWWVILRANGDPLALARLGTQFSQGDPNGTEGYDGQFIYYIARDPAPERVAGYLDVPAYRYQRILLPLLARLLALGRIDWIPWTIPWERRAARTPAFRDAGMLSLVPRSQAGTRRRGTVTMRKLPVWKGRSSRRLAEVTPAM